MMAAPLFIWVKGYADCIARFQWRPGYVWDHEWNAINTNV